VEFAELSGSGPPLACGPPQLGLVMVAVVTGGSKDIAAATRMLAANGLKVAVNARSQEGVDAVVKEIRRAGVEAVGVAADSTRWEEIGRLRTTTQAELGPIDILIPFGGGSSRYTPAQEITEVEWHEILDQNLTSISSACGPPARMIERRRHSVITMSSNTARFVDILTTASYPAAKGGLIAVTRHLAKEVGQYGIRVNAVAPATVLSERVDQIISDERRAEIAAMAPLGRMGKPDDVSHTTLFLASKAAGWITGVTLGVPGGRIML
jgi:3-oxoacyl-[acyl-carrier protein] reductase